MFPVADFSHRNFPGPGSVAHFRSSSISCSTSPWTARPTGPLTFTFTFTHEETPNNLDPCPYPTPPSEGCTDRVVFFEAPDPTTFTIGGKTYTLGLSFLDPGGDPIGEFITREGGVINSADLDTEFALVPPVLEVTKTGPATLTVAQPGDFVLDVRNTGPNDAWNATIRDQFPDGATGGLCDVTPEVLSARVFAADGVTPVPGKGPLTEGVDFTASFAGAPTCALDLTMASAASVISEDERLVITYRTQLDGDTQAGTDADERRRRDPVVRRPALEPGPRGLRCGRSPTAPSGPTTTRTPTPSRRIPSTSSSRRRSSIRRAAIPSRWRCPGDTLRYRLRFENRSANALSGFDFRDEIDRLNGTPRFEAGSLALVTTPVQASDTSGTNRRPVAPPERASST